jgi:5-methylcytosine-specific restriction endonuclease McrA
MEKAQNKLNIELVPEPLWGKSLATTLKRSEWDRVRRIVYQRQGFKCGICKAEGRLLCHEIWSYDDESHVQTLVGFKAVCTDCNNCIVFIWDVLIYWREKAGSISGKCTSII